MDVIRDNLRWGTEQRLEFIEFRLFWDGAVNRSDIVEKFGVSQPQASADLAQYRELTGDNLRYDSSEKKFLPSATFQPKFLKPNAERYLAQTKAIADDVIALSETWISKFENVGAMPIPSRRVDPAILRRLLQAVRTRRSVDIEYQSMNDDIPEPLWRTISPHAFSSDGLRWHLRAFCHRTNKFKDFVISRCLQIGQMREALSNPKDDIEWQTMFDVVLVPNQRLSLAQRSIIERDYNMTNGKCVLSVRLALLYYLDKRLRLDIAEQKDRPKETPVIVKNRSEYEKTLRSVAY